MFRIRKSTGAFWGLVFVALVWGSGFLAVKSILAEMQAVQLLAIRSLASLPLLWVVIARRDIKLLQRDHALPGLVLGLILGVALLFQTVGLRITSATNSAFITGFYVVLTPFLFWALYREIPSATAFFAAVIASVGVFLLSWRPGLAFNTGDFLTLLSAACFAAHIVVTGRVMQKSPNPDPLLLLFYEFLAVAAMGMLAMIVTQSWFIPALSWKTGLLLCYVVVLLSVVGYLGQTMAQRYIDSVRTAVILGVEPLSAAAFAWLIAGERTPLIGMLGGLLIVLGAVFSKILQKPSGMA